jgi:hypothetical protein
VPPPTTAGVFFGVWVLNIEYEHENDSEYEFENDCRGSVIIDTW